jgi:hypothetical protein
VVDIDILSLQEQNILSWVAEAEIGLAEPLPAPLADSPSEQVNAAVDRLARYGLLSPASTLPDREHTSLCPSLIDQGVQVVVELWRRRLRDLPKAHLWA